MADPIPPMRGRGTADNPANRFERLAYEPDPCDPDDQAPKTQFLRDLTRSIIASNDSPDIGFAVSINPYRGCEHGCIYCYARPTHEYLGFSAGLDFETRILVKEDSPQLLRRELSAPSWKPQTIGMSGVTDCYQPIERRLRLTRGCLEVLAECRNPVVVVTKNHLVARDADLLAELARFQAAAVLVSVTTLDDSLRQKLEPRATHPVGRLAAIGELAAAGVPVGVLVAPVIPGLTDHELPAIVAAAAKAGATFAGYTLLRLPHGLPALFEQWLDDHFPERKAKVLNAVRSMRGGRLNDPRFGTRMKGEGEQAELIREWFALACRKAGIARRGLNLSVESFRPPNGPQRLLFE